MRRQWLLFAIMPKPHTVSIVYIVDSVQACTRTSLVHERVTRCVVGLQADGEVSEEHLVIHSNLVEQRHVLWGSSQYRYVMTVRTMSIHHNMFFI